MTTRVHILGLVSLNGGDAAILCGQEAILRAQWPDLRLTVSDKNPRAAAGYLPHLQFFPFAASLLPAATGSRVERVKRRAQGARMRLGAELVARGRSSAAQRVLGRTLWRALEPMFTADVIAYTGGTTLTDNYDLSDKIFDLNLARRLGKTLVFLPQSAGPFAKSWNRDGLRPIFESADLVLLRDGRSERYVQDVGAPPERTRVVPDVVFALAPETPPHRERHDAAPRVAVSVRKWSHFANEDAATGMTRYASAIADVVVDLVRGAGAQVTFISTCQGRPEYWTDDSELAVEIASSLPADVVERVEVDRTAWNPLDLVGEMGRYDLMVSTRLHGAITALCAGTPVVPIAYEFKTTEVFGQLGLSEWVLDIEDIDGPSLVKATRAALDRRDEIVTTMTPAVLDLREQTLNAGPLIAAALEARS